LLLGLRDLNADFYSTPSAGNLLNSTFGIGHSLAQTGVNGPSIFPTAAPAITFKHVFRFPIYLKSGLFNAQAGDPSNSSGTRVPLGLDYGFLGVTEIGYEREKDSKPFKIGVGAWKYSQSVSAIDSNRPNGENAGTYYLFDIGITQSASVFFRHGFASEVYNSYSSSTEVGFVVTGVFPGRADDQLSIGLAAAEMSRDAITINGLPEIERVIELGYRFEAGRGVSLSPDVQYVFSPSAQAGIGRAVVGGIRIEANF